MSDTLSTLLNLAASTFDVPRSDLSPEQDFFDALGIDSVRAMDLLTEIELHFDVEIPDYEVQDVRTFAALSSVVERRR